MRSWLILLGGPLVWTVHFFGLYAIGEFAPNVAAVIALTLACLAVGLWLLLRFLRLGGETQFERWRRSVAVGGVGLGMTGVVWQALAVMAH